MPDVRNGDWKIHYEVTIDNEGPTLVLIAGLGEQIGAVEYPKEQCELFGNAGFRVIRLDNRETGLSETSDPEKPFSLLDMAEDVAAVIRDCAEGPVHVLGASLGGFIARWLAIEHPELVSSLTVVMSGCGAAPDEDGPQIEPAVREKNTAVLQALPRDEAINAGVEYWRWLWGNKYPFPEEFVRQRISYCFDRAYRPAGIGRQLQAAISTGGLYQAQSRISAPTLIVHGGEDPYFSAAHGEVIADRIPDATLWADPSMGHIMHQEQWQELADRVKELASRSV